MNVHVAAGNIMIIPMRQWYFLNRVKFSVWTRKKPYPVKAFCWYFTRTLLFQTTLRNHINNYTFFYYHKEEALHLSQRETEKVTCCLWNIEEELHHSIDTHSRTILSRHIELLLDYCTRYYERQFITRENKNKAILKKMEQLLEDYIGSGKLQSRETPCTRLFCGKTQPLFCLLYGPAKIWNG